MTATSLDLNAYCATSDEASGARFAIDRPFVAEGYEYATDLKIVIRVPSGEPNSPSSDRKRPDASKLRYWKDFPLQHSTTLNATIPERETQKCRECDGEDRYECPECDGEGEVHWYGRSGDSTYTATCQTCDGDGSIDERTAKKEGVTRKIEEKCYICHGKKVEEKEQKVAVCDLAVNAKYLRLIATLPGVVVQAAPDWQALLFEADGGTQGVIMGML